MRSFHRFILYIWSNKNLSKSFINPLRNVQICYIKLIILILIIKININNLNLFIKYYYIFVYILIKSKTTLNYKFICNY